VRGVTYEKTHACKETFKVTMRASGHGGARVIYTRRSTTSKPSMARSVRPVEVTGQTGAPQGHLRMIKSSRSEIGN
jgi:hypothetical protein